MKHRCELKVRTYECDAYNHVNNAIYLNYLEYARMEFLTDSGFDYAEFREAGYGLIVAKVCIEYKRPALYGDILTIETSSLRHRGPYGVFRQDVLKAGELLAKAEVTWFSVDAAGRPCPLPKEFLLPELTPDPKN
jgi:acyl-CoA thioester hydrolase